MEPSNPGDTTIVPPAVEPAAPAAQPSSQPNGSEPDNNPSASAMVPSDRLREETEKRRKAEEERESLKAELESMRNQPPSQNDDEIDPETEKILDSYAKKHGLISQRELAERESQAQVKRDITELESQYANSGTPFVFNDVMKYAKENNIPINSRASLVAVYRDMNYDKLMETERQRTIAQLKESNASAGEKPGSGGSKPPEETKVSGKTPHERNLSRIQQARSKVNQR